MALFQEAIIKKYLSTIDEQALDLAYQAFKRVYSPEKIRNIRVAKEEQYQEGFIKDVFGAVLGYSVYPEHPYNIETEKKNEANSKKADGAILKDEKVVGVIELKDNKTKNLDAVKDQAFGYKNNHKECSYVISSNFHKLRFYIDDATEYEEFDLYNLDKDTFKRFYLYLRKEGLLDKNIPKLLRQETKFHEEEISKKLYKDYSNFKRSFYENAVKNNPEQDKLLLFKKSQKFLDRILFLLFAEDKGLVGTNTIVHIVEKWTHADDDYYRPLYEMVNAYFGHLYRGYTYQKTGEVIPQFGGELFAPDDLLESLKIDDNILKNDLLVLSRYDFNTDVDVNILGHIFEHSLNEVDDVEAELRGETLDKSKSKRKKDGVFYTPKYITKYIVDNTLGKRCAEKKAEMKLDQDIAIFEYQKADGKLSERGKELFERLNAYQEWLLTLKVCDPACGSGAFLNQALSFFIEEHRFVDDIVAELTNTPLRLFDTDLQILENNIYGVDINEESIEIAKLSLWLRTAQSGRKLSDLSNNIKCGNSLIDDPTVAGEKAFCWEKEFPEVFEKGGFDVVIGNPPYVNVENLDNNVKKYLFDKYFSAQGRTDLYVLFVEKSIKILKTNGLKGLIIPYSFINQNYAKNIRERIIEENQLISIVDTSNYFVFADAIVKTIILTIGKTKTQEKTKIFRSTTPKMLEENFHEISQNEFKKLNKFVFETKPFLNLLKVKLKSEDNVYKLEDLCLVAYGVRVNHKTEKNKPKDYYIHKENINNYKKFIEGKDINRYSHIQTAWLNYQPKEHYNSMFPELFENPKLFFINVVSDRIRFSYDSQHLYNSHTVVNCVKIDKLKSSSHISARKIIENKNLKEIENYDIKYILTILNSNLLNWYFLNFLSEGLHFYPDDAKSLPIKKLDKFAQQPFIEKADLMLSLNKDLQSRSQKFSNYISSQYQVEKLSTKLSNWYELSFSEFIQELNKAIKAAKGTPLTKKDEFEWMELFEENKKKALELKSQIEQTDREIDRMVYDLYGLTEEEIQIVENS